MARKETRIQIDGMCRVPSSRPVKDGMASESLNLVSDMGECVPVLPPSLAEGEDIPESWRGENGEMVFVHVQPTYENHVYQVGQGIGTWGWSNARWVFTAFMEMADGETLNSIVNIGNTLIVSTSEATHYVLWKEGSYRDLGTELPKPAVQFIGGEREQGNIFISYGDDSKNDLPYMDDELYAAWDEGIWMEQPSIIQNASYDGKDEPYSTISSEHGKFFAGCCKYDYDDDDEEKTKNARIQAMWTAYADAVAQVSKFNAMSEVNGRAFYQPYFFRYALRLYDGTYARQSAPIMVGAGTRWPQFFGDAYLRSNNNDGHSNGSHTGDTGHYAVAMVMAYSARMRMLAEVSQDWSDIVTAVDVFCSSPINPVDVGDATLVKADFSVTVGYGMDYSHHGSSSFPSKSYRAETPIWMECYGKGDGYVAEKLLNYNVFYRIGSFLIDNSGFSLDDDYDPAQEFTANQEDLVRGIQLKKPDADTLVTHTSTASTDWDDYGADSTYHGNAQRVMNQRLAIWDIDETLGGGLPTIAGYSTEHASYQPSSPDPQYRIWYSGSSAEHRILYFINGDTAEYYVMGRNADGGKTFDPPVLKGGELGLPDGQAVVCRQYGWLAYPDTRCVRAAIGARPLTGGFTEDGDPEYEEGNELYNRKSLSEHPFLNCAYAWEGFGNLVMPVSGYDYIASTRNDDDWYKLRYSRERKTIPVGYQIMLSGAANPFTFPTAGRYTFDYAVISCAVANKPLSTGQVGDFKLYVLTKGGVWYMEMNNDGTFASSTPGPRDVAVSRKGVCEFDDGFVFITDRGVIAVQGGEFTDISQLMTGRHDPLPDPAVSALEGCGYGAEADDDAHTVLVPISALEGAWTDGSAFMAFMADATAGYDYKGDRMVFINDNFSWQWVWMRKTATWHRTMLWEGDYITDSENVAGAGAVRIRSFVNSWPGLLANLIGTGKGAEVCAVGEMTSQLDRTRDETLASTGLYVSRPLTFENPDVFKSIMDLRIRGDLRRGNAKHLLMSSNNGHDWVLRRSLRGPSFRFHRIAVVTKMTAQERLSYLEVEYDERFTNRLR